MVVPPVKISVYQLIINELMTELSFRKFGVGDAFYTEDELIKRFNVAKMTVREALRRMNDAGYITQRRGVGTFVRAVPDKPYRMKITHHCMLGVLPGKRGFKGSIPLTRMLAALHDKAFAKGYILCLGHQEAAPLLEGQIDGMIVLGDLEAAEIHRLQTAQVSVIGIGGKYRGVFPTLTTDMHLAGRQAWDYLFARGYRRIALVGVGKDAETVAAQMLPGILEAAAPENVINLVGHDALGRLELLLKERGSCPDALLLMNGGPVLPVLRLLDGRGLRVPSDIAMLVHGDKVMELDVIPPLSIIRHDFDQAATIAMEMMTRMLQGATGADESYGSFILERGSCPQRNKTGDS